MSSDATGEIYVVLRDKATNSTSPTTTGTAPAATSSKPSMAEKSHGYSLSALFAAFVVFCVSHQGFSG